MSTAEFHSIINKLTEKQQKFFLVELASKLGFYVSEKKLTKDDIALKAATDEGIKGDLVSKNDILALLN